MHFLLQRTNTSKLETAELLCNDQFAVDKLHYGTTAENEPLAKSEEQSQNDDGCYSLEEKHKETG